VASLDPPELFKIERGTVEGPVAHAWIGDIDAFEAFQKQRLSVAPLSPGKHQEIDPDFLSAAGVGTALEAVVREGAVSSTGELVFTARNTEGAFRYLNSASISVTQISPLVSDGMWHDLRAPRGPEVG